MWERAYSPTGHSAGQATIPVSMSVLQEREAFVVEVECAGPQGTRIAEVARSSTRGQAQSMALTALRTRLRALGVPGEAVVTSIRLG